MPLLRYISLIVFGLCIVLLFIILAFISMYLYEDYKFTKNRVAELKFLVTSTPNIDKNLIINIRVINDYKYKSKNYIQTLIYNGEDYDFLFEEDFQSYEIFVKKGEKFGYKSGDNAFYATSISNTNSYSGSISITPKTKSDSVEISVNTFLDGEEVHQRSETIKLHEIIKEEDLYFKTSYPTDFISFFK